VQRYQIEVVDGEFRVYGFPDAVKLISISGLVPHLPRQLADCMLHQEDLSFAQECVSHLTSPQGHPPGVAHALWRSAIIHYCKCFDQTGRIRRALPYSVFLPRGVPRDAHRYFIDLRNKHLIHDENSYLQAITGAVIGPEDRGPKVQEVVCTKILSGTMNPDNLGNLSLLVEHALKWVESRFNELCAIIKTELESHSYETLLAQPDVVYRAPTVEDISTRRWQE
jgi:hypothetical protein